jgi:hypothetical protein
VTDENVARIGRALRPVHAAVGVLTWDSRPKRWQKSSRTWAEHPRPRSSLDPRAALVAAHDHVAFLASGSGYRF